MEALAASRPVSSALPPGRGLSLIRYLSALVQARGDVMGAAVMAEHRWKDTPQVARVLKAAMDPGVTSDATWGGPLSEASTLAREFIEMIRPATVLGRLQGLRRVPFNVRVPRQLSSSTVGWVGQGAPKPVGELSFDDVTLGFAKAAGIVVVSSELMRLSNPGAEQLVRADLAAALIKFTDQWFISTAPAVADVSPAGILSGLTPIASAGSSIANVQTDLSAAIAQMIAGGSELANLYWITSPTVAVALAAKRSTAGDAVFPTVSLAGPSSLMGIPLLVSSGVGASVSGGSRLILIDASAVLLADDGQADFSISQQAAVQMNDAPSAGATTLTSLFQNNLIGIRCERFINWAPARATGVAVYADSVAY